MAHGFWHEAVNAGRTGALFDGAAVFSWDGIATAERVVYRSKRYITKEEY